nr:ATP-binding domain-containing protein [Rhodococcus kroppenstedtii]
MTNLNGLTVGTFHRELLRLAGLTRPPDNPRSQFWSRELPERAIESLINGGNAFLSDFLVVDEVQDIATDQYLDVLDLMIAGGLKEGRVLLFGDFERQAIYENATGRERIRARAPFMTSHKLIYNCRNLPRIGYQVNVLSRLHPGYQQFRRDDDGIDPVFHQYQAGQNQSPLLNAAIRRLKDEGYELNEIVILSPYQDTSTAATTEDPWLRQILQPVDGLPARPGHTQYSSIHAFKGLEASAIIVTDLDQAAAADHFDSVLYVGLTRATDRLIALIEKTTFRKALVGNR